MGQQNRGCSHWRAAGSDDSATSGAPAPRITDRVHAEYRQTREITLESALHSKTRRNLHIEISIAIIISNLHIIINSNHNVID